ncbi:Serine/threonine-protein kinase PBS1 [Capsicum baccatum]|uniref:Serine/threonine-protein kinase PBS1 n=1 Tax=Capsicum baccatum TaxID=33114 RepID=A0A2G2VNP5_CAPBA|nr:Serine/threonine-protein kinase PBS1 [Capsicum baccatum]
MGCFSCFDSKEEVKLNPQKDRDDRKEVHLTAPSNISRLSSGADRLKTRSTNGSKREFLGLKDAPDVQIAAHTFTFRELAAATNNFRPESFIGEGGFGRVYKGQLPSGQVIPFDVTSFSSPRLSCNQMTSLVDHLPFPSTTSWNW